jgi:hypothetical protein
MNYLLQTLVDKIDDNLISGINHWRNDSTLTSRRFASKPKSNDSNKILWF